jgi:exodeoxyribonuclease VII large subunit
MTKVVVLPVRVQGVEAPPEIVEAIKYVNTNKVADLIITGRGGGSIEDLWAFNDERVARAIFASDIPVISAVGHEPDVTIADFVADVRAATPSNAAEVAVPDKLDVFSQIKAADMRMQQAINRDIKTRRQRLASISDKRVLQSPKYYIDDKRVQIDRNAEKMLSAMQGQIYKKRERYARLAASLDAMSPLKVLGRGYAIARRTDGTVIKTAGDVKTGDRLIVRLKKDEITCVAE